MAPPPACSASQNQALCGPGCVSRTWAQVTCPICPARIACTALSVFGVYTRSSRYPAKTPASPRRRGCASPRWRSARAASCRGPLLPWLAASSIACSCRSFGRPTTTTPVSGCATAFEVGGPDRDAPVTCERLPAPRSGVHDLYLVPSALAVERHRVEEPDKARPQHRHPVARHLVSLSPLASGHYDRRAPSAAPIAANGPSSARTMEIESRERRSGSCGSPRRGAVRAAGRRPRRHPAHDDPVGRQEERQVRDGDPEEAPGALQRGCCTLLSSPAARASPRTS